MLHVAPQNTCYFSAILCSLEVERRSAAGSEATGDGDVTNLDEAAPLVILDQNSAQHSLENK